MLDGVYSRQHRTVSFKPVNEAEELMDAVTVRTRVHGFWLSCGGYGLGFAVSGTWFRVSNLRFRTASWAVCISLADATAAVRLFLCCPINPSAGNPHTAESSCHTCIRGGPLL